MPQDHSSFSSKHLTLLAGSAALSSEQQSKSLSAFDYEQMCLALVMIARRIQELKTAEADTSERCENQ